LAEMLGASQGVAIDNDEWSVENALENIERNQREKIQVKLGSLEIIAKDKFDVVLANINRHILLNYIPQIYEALNTNGVILMSGLLTADEEIIVKAATGSGFRFLKMKEQNNWIALLFAKF